MPPVGHVFADAKDFVVFLFLDAFQGRSVPSVGTWIWALLAISIKSAQVRVPKDGSLSAQIKKRRPLFHANSPSKWWNRLLFYAFTTFGRVIG